MNLMHNPGAKAFFCWLESCETIEEGWQCEARDEKDAAEQYYAHIGISGDVVICVGSSTDHERWKVSRSGEAELAA